MKPYSLDLRQKIIETYEQEAISQRNLAKRFRVALQQFEIKCGTKMVNFKDVKKENN